MIYLIREVILYMGIIQNIFKRKDANKISLKQRIIIQEANELSDEEAIENVKRESEYYRNAKAVEEVVKKILNEHKIMIPPTFETDDISLNRAKAILDVKGLSMPDIQLEELVITRNDIKAGLYRAYMGLDGLLEYYNATSEERAENSKIFKDLMENGIPSEYNSDLEQSTSYFEKRYAVPEIFYNPALESQETPQCIEDENNQVLDEATHTNRMRR